MEGHTKAICVLFVVGLVGVVRAANVDDFAAKRLQHLLHKWIAFRCFAQTLFFETCFVLGIAWFALGLAVFDRDAQAGVLAHDFAAGGADQFCVFGFEERFAQVAILRSEFDEEFGVVESCFKSVFECSD